jgi:hypothetical protein
LRCSRCGNDNPDSNRFCGMCGATLLETPVPPGERPAATSTAAAAATKAEPISARTAPPSVEEIRGVAGPSFLGLNEPPARGRRTNLSIDPNQRGSRDLDYLLEDEEEPKGSSAGKVFLILIALALAVGFGYLRWKNQGLPWLGSGHAKPAATAQNESPPDGNGATPATPEGGANQPAATPTENTAPPATGNAAPANGGATAPPANAPSARQPATNPPAASQPTANPTAAAQPAANQPSTLAPAAGQGNPAPANSDGATADKSTASSGDSADSAAQPAAEKDATPAPAAKAETAAAKPHAAIAPADPVSEAQKYLYGRRVPQDCGRGLRILKPSADSGNPKAMIEMGALYSAGLCTPRDLPTSYRWFAMALRKDPSNVSLQSDLNKLWGEMTQPERQLAIRLSQ